jgi:hypothetical protein
MSAMATEAQALVEPPSASDAAAPTPAPPTAGQTPPDGQTKGKGKDAKGKDAKGKDAKGKDAKGKDAKGKDAKDKKGKAEHAASAEDSASPSVAAHPRAARAVVQAKAWGGLAGFFIAGYLSLPTGTLAEAALRALIAGSVCYVAAWAGAVFVWRRLVIVEIKGREQALLTSALAALEPGEAAGATTERPRAGATSRTR